MYKETGKHAHQGPLKWYKEMVHVPKETET
jgi:hypothetical protein